MEIKVNQDQFSEMCLWAFRYALGRMTYAGPDTVAWLKAMWGYIQPSDRKLITKELGEWLGSRSSHDSHVGHDIYNLWMDLDDWICDRENEEEVASRGN